MITKAKQPKPYENFPLTWHAGSKQWIKKIKQRQHYFGADADKALASYLDCRDDLHAGREPKAKQDVLTVGDLCNRFLLARRALVASGELSPRSWAGYHETSKLIIDGLGRTRAVADLGPSDFAKLRAKLADGRAPTTLGVHIVRTRAVLRWAYDAELVPTAVKTGRDFAPPSKATLRKAKAAKGERMYSRDDLRTIIESADPLMRAVVLLGVNAAYGPSDCAKLPLAAVDLDGGWATYARGKTGVARKAALWPETTSALRAWLALRPTPARGCEDFVFVNRLGGRLSKEVELPDLATGGNPTGHGNGLVIKYRTLVTRLGLSGTPYDLRRTFRTVADESLDGPAIDVVMGHTDNSMGATYRQRISDDRLKRVAEFVRTWLFGDVAAVPPTQELAAV